MDLNLTRSKNDHELLGTGAVGSPIGRRCGSAHIESAFSVLDDFGLVAASSATIFSKRWADCALAVARVTVGGLCFHTWVEVLFVFAVYDRC